MTSIYEGKVDQNYEEELSNDKAEERAAKLGLKVVTPEADELFLDIDTEDSLKIFHERMERLNKIMKPSFIINPSASGEVGHYHIYVKLPRDIKSEQERIFLQIYLGSDPAREFWGWARTLKSDKCPTLFFERPEVERPQYAVEILENSRAINL